MKTIIAETLTTIRNMDIKSKEAAQINAQVILPQNIDAMIVYEDEDDANILHKAIIINGPMHFGAFSGKKWINIDDEDFECLALRQLFEAEASAWVKIDNVCRVELMQTQPGGYTGGSRFGNMHPMCAPIAPMPSMSETSSKRITRVRMVAFKLTSVTNLMLNKIPAQNKSFISLDLNFGYNFKLTLGAIPSFDASVTSFIKPYPASESKVDADNVGSYHVMRVTNEEVLIPSQLGGYMPMGPGHTML